MLGRAFSFVSVPACNARMAQMDGWKPMTWNLASSIVVGS
ncbi:MAG: hypothetical protein ACI93T_002200, partial [Porticoccaceae bacterium]